MPDPADTARLSVRPEAAAVSAEESSAPEQAAPVKPFAETAAEQGD
jgi:hypothetical protein